MNPIHSSLTCMTPATPLTSTLTVRRLIAATAASVVIALLAACSGSNTASAEKPAAAEKSKEQEGIKLSKEEADRAGIVLEELKAQILTDTVRVTATIRPNQDRIARIAPRVEGRIATVSANLGDMVRAGQTLATLDSLAVGEASSALSQARSADRVAEADYKRAASLQAEEIISQKEFLRSRAEYEKSRASLRAAEDRLKLLGVTTGEGKGMASVFPLATPFAGTVIEKKATVGGLAGPADALFVVADLSTVWIEANLAEAQLAKVRVGAQAAVTVGAYPGERFGGRVTYVASVLDKDTRTVPARIEVENKDARLKPEMFATATIEGGQGAQAAAPAKVLTVPDSAIVLMQGQANVFVFENGGYEQRAIDPGERLGNRTIVKSGLKPGEQIVSAGTYALKARILKSQIGTE
ncbi:efflux RND transporter periplasmic adaptor subunit [Variovorax sp. NFACC27]|uniref:efflux RND transporter periplasmic adaptor subunit n=1 Tax=unclassified Variovorax TaxID=663243 RepID=UPI0008988ABF|nr:membrane fusion protein, cobalt-zinc-cadmium efflux system [Variovorax sp. NFACC28]SEG98999.1 membrane fusion protein, cobalt-zinc-cadmium efflux system [Variovorax sp. NFACC29]SFE16469.1 membrane fusion protein, cobalt-zinc-cadmium efflux system [Variovorax sp. NFACC26]SFH06828.1 membrane fusion protein, cobalt-zinc-cadmium efflux system [Variovorax sp. NFACC27]SEF35241.1 membrane fusion protein, cobalt-zinc-cadmium efflux system [Variovorax sp. NFACC28]